MRCAIVGEKQLDRLMRKYLGLEPANLTADEREILLFALYMESVNSGGIGARATAEGDARVAQAKAKLDAIIAAETSAPPCTTCGDTKSVRSGEYCTGLRTVDYKPCPACCSDIKEVK